jgi:DNA-binding NarL/FixJ family response regulator
MRIRVLLADDHPAFRRSFRDALERYSDLEVVGEADSGLQAVDLAGRLQPDLAILDVRMKDISGIEAIPGIRRCSPRTAIVMLSMHRDPRYVTESLKAGAREYMLKDSAEDDLVTAMRRACIGRGPQSPCRIDPAC